MESSLCLYFNLENNLEIFPIIQDFIWLLSAFKIYHPNSLIQIHSKNNHPQVFPMQINLLSLSTLIEWNYST